MSRILAIEWDAREARVVVARRRGQDAVIEEALAIDLQLQGGETEVDVGQRLSQALSRFTQTRTETVVAVGRASIELRVLTVPPAPPEELPDMVRFQALKEFTTLGDDWPLDFVHLGQEHDGSSSVLAAAIAPDLVEHIRQTCHAAGLDPKRLVLRPFAAAALWRQRDDSPRCSLMVDSLADEADLTVLVEGHVGFMRTVRLPVGYDEDEQTRSLMGELRRTIAAAQNQLGNRRVERMILCGGIQDHLVLGAQIQQQLGIEVEAFDPFDGMQLGGTVYRQRPENSGRYAPLLGMIADEAAGREHSIDFLHPRRRPQPISYRRRNLLIASAAGAIVLAGAGWIWSTFSDLSAQTSQLQFEVRQLDDDLKRFKPIEDDVQKIDAFTRGDIPWLDEFYRFSKNFLPVDEALVSEVNVQVENQGAQAVVEGYVRQSSSLDRLQRQLRTDRRAVISSGSREDEHQDGYPWWYRIVVKLDPEDAEERFDPSATRSEGAKETSTVATAAQAQSANSPGKDKP